jgi:sugar lactone lactonase YvrE
MRITSMPILATLRGRARRRSPRRSLRGARQRQRRQARGLEDRTGPPPERLPGSAGMRTPNALAFDADGDLYVTDSEDGTIWRFPRTGTGALWLRHPLLAHAPGFGVGANGILFRPPGTLFVANTEQGLIVQIPIERSGAPGEPHVVASGPELLTVDSLAIDPQGFICAAIVFGGIGRARSGRSCGSRDRRGRATHRSMGRVRLSEQPGVR